jgi:hypothetical protein
MTFIARRTRSVLVAVLALTAIAAVTASAASAAVKDEWVVNKTVLASGKSESLTGTIKAGGQLKFSYLLLGDKVEFVSPQVKFTGALEGGTPGTGTITGLTFEKITVKKPAKCTIHATGSVESLPFNEVKTTVVEGAGSGAGDGKALVLLQPKTGTTFTTFELQGSECALAGIEMSLSGSILAEGLQSEASTQTLTVLPYGSEYIPHGGAATKAGASVGESSVALEGASEVKLVSGEAFAAL